MKDNVYKADELAASFVKMSQVANLTAYTVKEFNKSLKELGSAFMVDCTDCKHFIHKGKDKGRMIITCEMANNGRPFYAMHGRDDTKFNQCWKYEKAALLVRATRKVKYER